MSKKTLVSEKVDVDKETGEVTVIEKTFSIKKAPQDEFFMTYIQNMKGFFNINSIVDVKILGSFCTIAEYNTGKVGLYSAIRKRICSDLGIAQSQLSRSITSLKKLNLITGSDGEFFINPMVFWKGDNKRRSEVIKDRGLQILINFKQDE